MTDPRAAGDDTADQWLAESRQRLSHTRLAPEAASIGRVERIADAIAQISGLPEVRLNELLHFERGQTGFALTLDAHAISAVVLDGTTAIEAGSRVSRTGAVMQVPVGPDLLGRIVDPLGRPSHNRRFDPGNSVKVPGEIDAQRARRVLEELRRRLGDADRSREEIDYLERLLKE